MNRVAPAVALVGLGVIGGVIGVAIWAWPSGVAEPAPERPAASGLPGPRTPSPERVESGEEVPVGETARVETFRERLAGLERDCGLAVESHCEGPACVALMEAPDLDSPLGWMEMVRRQPTFVASTALRDLGVPPEKLPCGAAIGELTQGYGAAMLEREDGTEVWCAIDAAASDVSVALTLCDAESERLGWDVRGFGEDDTRILRFAPLP